MYISPIDQFIWFSKLPLDNEAKLIIYLLVTFWRIGESIEAAAEIIISEFVDYRYK